MAVYAYRSGRSLKGVSPQVVGEELERIRQEKGTLNPELVLEQAQEEDSPLHSAFEWDDTAAAKKWRLTEARRLIISVRVCDGPAQPKVAYVSVRHPEKGREYIPTVEALSDEQIRTRLLDEARQFIESLERRYRHLSDVGDVLKRLRGAVG